MKIKRVIIEDNPVNPYLTYLSEDEAKTKPHKIMFVLAYGDGIGTPYLCGSNGETKFWRSYSGAYKSNKTHYFYL